jgi:hypothetical protein
LSHADYLAWLDRSVKYEAECDRALKSIGLDSVAKPVDPYELARQRATEVARQATIATQAEPRAAEGDGVDPGAKQATEAGP